MKRALAIILGSLYGLWAYWVPMSALRTKYGESGLMWGILVFAVMIPYVAYFVYGMLARRKK